MSYATVSKGYKSGGYFMNSVDPKLRSYDKETLWNYEVGVKYRGNNGIFAKYDIHGQDKYYVDKANKFGSKQYSLMDVKIGYESTNYEVYLYYNNITNKKYDLKGFEGGYLIMVSDLREIGVSFAYRF